MNYGFRYQTALIIKKEGSNNTQDIIMGPIKRGIVNLTNNLNNLNRKYIKNSF